MVGVVLAGGCVGYYRVAVCRTVSPVSQQGMDEHAIHGRFTPSPCLALEAPGVIILFGFRDGGRSVGCTAVCTDGNDG